MTKAELIDRVLDNNNLSRTDVVVVNLVSDKRADMVQVDTDRFFDLMSRLNEDCAVIRGFEIVGNNWFVRNEDLSTDEQLTDEQLVFYSMPNLNNPADDSALDELIDKLDGEGLDDL